MKLPKSSYNYLSLIGATIASVSLFMIVFLFIISTFFEDGGSYLGLIIFIVLPVFLVIGLILIPIGMFFKHKRDKKRVVVDEKQWPSIDFNISRNRNAFIVFMIGSIFFLLVSAIGSYEAFHYSESVEFCGTICHKVMEPEYVAYQNSSHARVSCAGCHVGPGAGWYVKSKLSGLYQVYAVVMDVYPKPITTPITSLRPARETCEKCHWPEKFYAHQHRKERHYLPDEQNTGWDINMQIKTGPSYSSMGLVEGIHWHINPDVTIEYYATADRASIPWVKYMNSKTGEEYIYRSDEDEFDDNSLDTLEMRTMDCMDCHNRPSHLYNSPMKFINDALTAGTIPKELPDIKTVSMQVLHVDFPTKDSAFKYIEQEINFYYEMMYDENLEEYRPMIDQSIMVIKEEFSKNIFPFMKVNWEVYPDHIGHLETDGCFRCHNDKHQTDDGRVIPLDCNLCHHILAQGSADSMQVSNIYESLEFWHPNDDEGGWKDYLCSECHRDLYKE